MTQLANKQYNSINEALKDVYENELYDRKQARTKAQKNTNNDYDYPYPQDFVDAAREFLNKLIEKYEKENVVGGDYYNYDDDSSEYLKQQGLVNIEKFKAARKEANTDDPLSPKAQDETDSDGFVFSVNRKPERGDYLSGSGWVLEHFPFNPDKWNPFIDMFNTISH